MAVDKLVDSTQLDADLTSVANAIRTKGGTSAQLAFPADFLTAIAAIPSGGGGATYKTGTYTPTSDINTDGSTTITNLATIGFTPKAFVFGVKSRADVSNVQYAILAAMYGDVNGSTVRGTIRYTNASNTIGGTIGGTAFTTNTAPFLWLSSADNINIHRTQNYILKANVEYVWYAWG